MRLEHTQFPLHPDTPDEGLDLAAYFKGRGMDPDAMHARMQSLMAAEGLPYRQRARSSNSRLAQELGRWADSRGVPAIHDALYRAYFVDGVNIGDRDELVKIAGTVGLPTDEARAVLDERGFRDRVDRDWRRAGAMGVTGVPTFVCGGRGVVGAQPYETLEKLVRAVGAQPVEG